MEPNSFKPLALSFPEYEPFHPTVDAGYLPEVLVKPTIYTKSASNKLKQIIPDKNLRLRVLNTRYGKQDEYSTIDKLYRVWERFAAWKNGEQVYKDGLPAYKGGDKPITVGEYKVYPSAIGASELNVTTPEVVVTGKDRRPMYQRYDAEHSTYDPNAIKNITEFAPGIGDVQQGFDAYNAAKNGNYTEAAMLGGLLLLPNVLEKSAVYGKKFLSTALDEFARNKKGYYRIANDFLTDPIRLISDHFNGNYPLTYSLRKDFIKKRNEFFNKQMDIADAYEKVQRDKRLLRHGQDSFFFDDKAVRPNIITARSIKPTWNGSRNFYDPVTHSISIPTRTNKYSNFVNFTDPNQLGIFHHEYTHSLQDPRNSMFAPYLSISRYDDNFGHRVPYIKNVKYFTGEYNPYTEAEDWFNVAKYAKQKGDLTFFEKNKHSMDADEWVANARAIKLSPGYTEKDFINYYGDKIRKELLDERSRKMAELIGYKDGKSPIRIKPANRGKLTRLKKRTGKSESELYNDGNPAHKKMVVFARNARKWSHKR